jgi:trimeric autotransporter adhesin
MQTPWFNTLSQAYDYPKLKPALRRVWCTLTALTFFIILTTNPSFAQAPQGFKYQSVARNSNGLPIASADVGLRIGVRDLTATGSLVYRETHVAATNEFGVFTISVGGGTVVSGNFSTIAWGGGAKYIEVEADFTGGTAYVSMGTSQLLSVPYALYSENGTPGPPGQQGPVGLTGPTGATGSQGPAGQAGTNGKNVLNGVADPVISTGADGEFYINTTTQTLFGPKTSGAWPSGISLVGPAGAAGNDGADGADGAIGAQGLQGIQGLTGAKGLNVLNGVNDPLPGSGADGEFYINTATSKLFGPKTAGVWPTGVSLIGPAGIAGTNGLHVLNGIVDPSDGGEGVDGEFYINTATNMLFGPKASGTWPAGVSLVGPAGPTGILPPGAVEGNTPYWDGTNWVVNSSNIFNGGGNVGIGTSSPGATLEVSGNVKITGGSPGNGKVLTSDADGLATWATPPGVNTAGGAFTIFMGADQAGRIEAPVIVGTGNTFYGYKSGNGNSGSSNTANGVAALTFNTSGAANAAFGSNSLVANTSGNSNTGIGAGALTLNTTGSNNTALGYIANVGAAGLTNATAIGSGAIVNASNAIQLGDLNVTQVFAGTGTTATFITGGLQVTGGTPGAGKVLTSDADGVATWQPSGGGGSGWLLTGSSGTIDGVNFLGTTDNVPLSFRVNNQKAGRIDPNLNNTFFGLLTGNAITSGSSNSAFGRNALTSNTTGQTNTALGDVAMQLNITGTGNVGVGASSLSDNTTGSFNTDVGSFSNFNNTTGNFNTAIGNQALRSNMSGSATTAIGARAMFFANNAAVSFTTHNVAVGFEALRGSGNASDNTGVGNTSIGSQSMKLNSTGAENTAAGYLAMSFNETGSQNTAVGNVALAGNTTGNGNTAIGWQALNANGDFNTALGFGATIGSNGLINATAIGNSATVYSSNTIQLGNASVTHVFAGSGNTSTLVTGGLQVTGGTPGAGKVLTSDANGVATWEVAGGGGGGGGASGWSLTGSAGTVDGTNFIGTTDNIPLSFRVNNEKAGRIDHTLNNTFFGYQAGNLTTDLGNSGFGHLALSANTTGQLNTAFGYGSIQSNSTGFGNVAMGMHSLFGNTTGHYNIGIGTFANFSNNAGSFSTAVGYQALYSNKAGSNATAVGTRAMYYANSTISPYTNTNVAVGYEALRGSTTASLNTGGLNTAIGYQSLTNNSSGSENTATGFLALNSNSDGSQNTAYGNRALGSNMIGSINTAIGYLALTNNSGGGDNTAIGAQALQSNISGSFNTAAGKNSLRVTSGSNNTAFGVEALSNNSSGNNNTAIGYNANVNPGTLTNATAIGSDAIVTASNTIQLGNSAVTLVQAGTNNTTKFVTGGLQVTGSSPGVGKVLTSDASGNATWQTASTAVTGSGTLNYLPRFSPNGTTIGNSVIFDDGTNIGIGTSTPSSKLDVNGNISIPSTNNYAFTSARSKTIIIGNAAFETTGPAVSRNISTVNGIPVSIYTTAGTLGSISAFTAPITLPDGAVVTELRAYVFDSNVTYDVTVLLTRQDFGTLHIDNMASVTSTGAPLETTYTTSSITNGTIDNSTYSYQLVFQSLANGNHALLQVRLAYTISKVD